MNRLAPSPAALTAIFDASPDALIVCDDGGVIVLANPSVRTIFGYDPKELLGRSVETLVHPAQRARHEARRIAFQEGPSQRSMTSRRGLVGVRKDGSEVPIDVGLSPLSLEEGSFTLAAVRDVSHQRLLEKQLEFVSTHDPLTGLYNRLFFDAEVARLGRGRARVGIMMIDVDNLKIVNDQHGHAAGDALIRAIAEVLSASFRADDIVARIGGDEFAILLPSIGAGEQEGASERLRSEVARAKPAAEVGGPLSISIGVATAATGADLQEALKVADARMYEDKRARKASALSRG